MNSIQLSIFDAVDLILEKFNQQLPFIVVNYRHNHTWESQNRVQYFLETLNGTIGIYCTVDHVVVRSLSFNWNRFRIEDWLYIFNPKLNIWIKEKNNVYVVVAGDERKRLDMKEVPDAKE